MAQNVTGDKFDLYIVSFTHWDREWYYSFETFRQMLISLMDNVAETLIKDKRFKAFHLDGQTIQISDYLEIKPQNKRQITELARSHKLIPGPNYIQSDEFLASGESLVRNFIIGHLDCEILKTKPLKVAMPLDQFGHCSQTPQICKGFGISRIVLGRGIIRESDVKNSFYWESPDGSRCLTNFLTQWYNNFQRAPHNPEDGLALIANIINGQKEKIIGKSILLMNGVDHLDIQKDLHDCLERIKAKGIKHNLIHCSIEDFFDALEQEMASLQNKPVVKGELRDGTEPEMLSGTLSARLYLKQQNAFLASRIEKYLEPISALSDIVSPGFYPIDTMKYLWRLFLQNQPHDSICGCSIDETHYQMVARFHRVNDVYRFNYKKAAEFLSYQISFDSGKNKDAEEMLLVWNPTAHERTEVVELTVEMPIYENKDEWLEPIIYAADDRANPIKTRIHSIEKIVRIITHSIRLPMELPVHQYKMTAELPNIPPLGYKTFFIAKGKQIKPIISSIKEINAKDAVMENEHLRVSFNPDGTIVILDKASNVSFKDMLRLTDSGDAGHEYIYVAPQNNKIITNNAKETKIYCLEKSDLKTVYKISATFNIPEGVDFIDDKRKDFELPHTIETFLTLKKGSKVLDVTTRFINQSKNHRLEVGFGTEFDDAKCYADSAFDLVNRTQTHFKDSGTGQPNSGLIIVKNKERGVAVFADGLPEYHYIPEKKILNLTILRSVGALGHHIDKNLKEKIAEYVTYDSQRIGEITAHYGIYVSGVSQTIEEYKKHCDLFLNPPETSITLTDTRKYLAKTNRNEFKHNYFDPAYEDLYPYTRNLPTEASLLRISNPAIVFSAFKRAERAPDIMICRVYNISDKKQNVSFDFLQGIEEIHEANLNEKPIKKLRFKENSISLSLAPKKILTLYIKFK